MQTATITANTTFRLTTSDPSPRVVEQRTAPAGTAVEVVMTFDAHQHGRLAYIRLPGSRLQACVPAAEVAR